MAASSGARQDTDWDVSGVEVGVRTTRDGASAGGAATTPKRVHGFVDQLRAASRAITSKPNWPFGRVAVRLQPVEVAPAEPSVDSIRRAPLPQVPSGRSHSPDALSRTWT